jgi:hypothetical protein
MSVSKKRAKLLLVLVRTSAYGCALLATILTIDHLARKFGLRLLHSPINFWGENFLFSVNMHF